MTNLPKEKQRNWEDDNWRVWGRSWEQDGIILHNIIIRKWDNRWGMYRFVPASTNVPNYVKKIASEMKSQLLHRSIL
jgi:hypothetical protein